MKRATDKEVDAVFRMEGSQRIRRFLDVVVESKAAWGVWRDGWLALADEQERVLFPLWPAPEYAEKCCVGRWADAEPRRIELERLISEILPNLYEEQTRLAIVPSPSAKGATISADECRKLLQERSASTDPPHTGLSPSQLQDVDLCRERQTQDDYGRLGPLKS